MLTGENGILTQAQKANEETSKTEFEESVDLALNEWQIEKNTGGNKNFKDFLDDKKSEYNWDSVVDNGNETCTIKKEKWEIIAKSDGTRENATESVAVTDVWYKVDGTTLHLSNSQLDDGYILGYNGNFTGSSSITKIIIDNKIVPTTTANWFNSTYNITEIENIENINTSNVTDMSWMFYCPELTSLDLSSFNTTKVTNMQGMFDSCEKLSNLNINGWDTSKVTDMSYMFRWCNFTTLDVSKLDTSKVTDMHNMFSQLFNIESLDLSNFDTSNVKDMSRMFDDCTELRNLDLSMFETNSLTNVESMFKDCPALEELHLTKMNTSNITKMSRMFENCPSSAKIYVGSNWNLTPEQTGFTGTFVTQ